MGRINVTIRIFAGTLVPNLVEQRQTETRCCFCSLGSREARLRTSLCQSRHVLDLAWSYLLGLLAMIKCSICSYQCDN